MSKRKIDAADVEGDRWGVDEAAQAEADVEADRSDLFERRRLMDDWSAYLDRQAPTTRESAADAYRREETRSAGYRGQQTHPQGDNV